MEAHTSLWLPHLLRQSSKVPVAALAAGSLLSARTWAAIGRVPLQLTGPPTWPQLLDPASLLAWPRFLRRQMALLPCMEVPEYNNLGSSSTFSGDLLLVYIGVSLST